MVLFSFQRGTVGSFSSCPRLSLVRSPGTYFTVKSRAFPQVQTKASSKMNYLLLCSLRPSSTCPIKLYFKKNLFIHQIFTYLLLPIWCCFGSLERQIRAESWLGQCGVVEGAPVLLRRNLGLPPGIWIYFLCKLGQITQPLWIWAKINPCFIGLFWGMWYAGWTSMVQTDLG